MHGFRSRSGAWFAIQLDTLERATDQCRLRYIASSLGENRMLTWVHFGDLHASDEDGWQSVDHLKALVADANRHLAWRTDFAFLPGDNANHGEPEQYRRISEAIDALDLPWFAIPGDHDFEPNSLDNFYKGLGAPPLPHSKIIKRRRCLFLDIISPGSGGPDFRLGEDQTRWLTEQLERSKADAERPLVFMHAFPSDLQEGADALAHMFADAGVAAVDTGHTHYNELLNDGGAIYTATRSTGQIEEGPVGFSLHAVDGNAVSWRFKPSEQLWPFVLITSPCDHRLIVDPSKPDQAPRGPFTVRAKVFGENVDRVSLTIDGGDPVGMTRIDDEAGVWSKKTLPLPVGEHRLQVTARSSAGTHDSDAIVVRISSDDAVAAPKLQANPGDHLHSIGAWPEHGLLASQLGPNKNGTIKW